MKRSIVVSVLLAASFLSHSARTVHAASYFTRLDTGYVGTAPAWPYPTPQTCSTYYPSDVQPGDLLLVVLAQKSATLSPPPTDSYSDTYSLVGSASGGSGASVRSMALYYAVANGSGTLGINFPCVTAPSEQGMLAYAGNSSAPLDASGVLLSYGSAPHAATNRATTASGDLIVSFVMSTESTSFSYAAGYRGVVQGYESHDGAIAVEDKGADGLSSYLAGATPSPSFHSLSVTNPSQPNPVNYIEIVATFKHR
jgi:hypothetical protein